MQIMVGGILHGVDARRRGGGGSPLVIVILSLARNMQARTPARTRKTGPYKNRTVRDADYKERCTFPAGNLHHQADPSARSYARQARQVHCSWVDHHILKVSWAWFFSSLANLRVEVVAALAEWLQFLKPDLLQQGQLIVKIKVRIV